MKNVFQKSAMSSFMFPEQLIKKKRADRLSFLIYLVAFLESYKSIDLNSVINYCQYLTRDAAEFIENTKVRHEISNSLILSSKFDSYIKSTKNKSLIIDEIAAEDFIRQISLIEKYPDSHVMKKWNIDKHTLHIIRSILCRMSSYDMHEYAYQDKDSIDIDFILRHDKYRKDESVSCFYSAG